MKVKELIEKLKGLEDFEIDCRIERLLTDEELKGSTYPYPYDLIKATIEIVDVGYSDKVVCIHIESEEDKK